MAMGSPGRGGKQFYADQMFNLGGAAVTALTAMNPGVTAAAGAYAPKLAGNLEKIIIKVTPQAASSLAQSGYVYLNCPKWKLNTQIFAFSGFGIATAPQLLGGNLEDTVYPPVGDGYFSLPVEPQTPIIGQVVYFYSPVTPSIVVQGLFSS